MALCARGRGLWTNHSPTVICITRMLDLLALRTSEVDGLGYFYPTTTTGDSQAGSATRWRS